MRLGGAESTFDGCWPATAPGALRAGGPRALWMILALNVLLLSASALVSVVSKDSSFSKVHGQNTDQVCILTHACCLCHLYYY